MRAKLTKSLIKTLEPQDKPFEVSDSALSGFLLRVQPTGRMTYYFAYRNKGSSKKKRIKIGTASELTVEMARDAAKKYSALVADGVDIADDKNRHRENTRQAEGLTLSAFIDDRYKAWVLASQKSGQETLDTLAYSFPNLMNKPLSEFTHSLVDKWRTQKLEAGLMPSTINRRVTALRGVLRRAVNWGLLERHPLDNFKDLKVDKAPKVRFLTPEENTRLFNALQARDQRLKDARERGNAFRRERGYKPLKCLLKHAYGDRMTPLILLAIKTGMRRGELFDLTWKDIDFDRKLITVKGDITKSMNTRYIPLGPSALEALENWRKQCPSKQIRVFPADKRDTDGKEARLNNVKKSWASILDKANIENLRWHDLRHDYASQLVMKGVPLNTVRELCGHEKFETTLRYAHLAPNHKAEAVALLG